MLLNAQFKIIVKNHFDFKENTYNFVLRHATIHCQESHCGFQMILQTTYQYILSCATIRTVFSLEQKQYLCHKKG